MKFENTNNIGCGKNRKHIFSKVLLMVLLAVFSFSLYGQDDDNKEFWFVAPDASKSHADRPTFLMITTGDKSATVTISMPKNPKFRQTFTDTIRTLDPYESWKFELIGDSVEIFENSYQSSGEVTNKGIYVTSTEPVSAYYQIDGDTRQREVFTFKGKKALGKEFYMPFQTEYPLSDRRAYRNEQYRQIQIVATENNTVVWIHPRTENAKFGISNGSDDYEQECVKVRQVTGANDNNPTYTDTCYYYINSETDINLRKRILNRGETLLWREAVRNTPDLTGTKITSDKPIAVSLFEDCVEGGTPGGSADPIGDQLVPTDNLGQHYIVIKGYSSGTARDHAVILAVDEGETEVWVREQGQQQETLVKTLTQGESHTVLLGLGNADPGAYYIRTTQPVYCMHQSATGTEVGGALLPSLYSISGRRLTFVKAKTMRDNSNNLGTNAMFLVFRETAKDGFTLNGNPIENFDAKEIGFDGWYYAKVNLPEEEMICTVANEDGSFALGYFHGTPTGTSLYGYLSAFGTFAFDNDIIYAYGDSYQFDAPYARTYTWTLPNDSIVKETSRLVAKRSGRYTLTVEQDPYKITDETYLKLQNFNHELSKPDSLLLNKSYKFKFELKSDAVHQNDFTPKCEWDFGGEGFVVKSGSLNAPEVEVYFTTRDPEKKMITLHVINENIVNCDTTIFLEVVIPPTPEEMYWRSDAQDRNWNNEENWVDVEGNPLSVVPSIETRVYLPGYLEQDSYYPSLNESETDWRYYGQPEADEIIFRYGSELHHQHKLKYNKAYVNYNWGYYDGDFSTGEPQNSLENGIKLPRNTWHMLAAPLKSMASGDFSLAGHPFSWQRQFQVINNPPGGSVTVGDFSTPFSTNDIPLAGNNNAIAVKMAEYRIGDTGYRQQDYLEGLRGVIEIPYFENNGMTQYYPAHSYDALSKNSYFYYFDTKTLRIIDSPMGSMKRAGEAYRFVYEDADGNLPVGGVYEMDIEVPEGAREVMVGSPLLAPIDAMAFWEKNKNTIDKDYGYKLLSEDGETWEHRDFTLDNEIPAWKAFIVTLQPEASKIFFPLEVEVDGEPTTDIAPVTNSTRSSYAAGPSNDVLYVQVLKGGIRSGDAARLQYNRDRDKPDIRKMILPEGHRTPEVFFISPDGKSSNLIQQYSSGEKEVAIGVKTSDVNSRLSLEFGNIAAFSASTGASVILVDKHQNVRQDLTRNPVYSFTQQSSGLDNQYVDRYRFVLQLGGNAGPETEEDAVEGINIVYRSGILEVTSDENINTVLVYDLYGRLIFSSPSINLAQYTHPVPLKGKVYLVRVKTVSGKEKVRRIMAN